MTDFTLSQGLSALAALFAVHLLVVASPGPAFLAVSRTAISSSRAAGIAAAAGLATGALIWAVATMFGLDVLFARVPWLYDAMRLGGAAYLIYLGLGMLRSAWRGERMHGDAAGPAGNRAFLRSLGVQLSNPKVIVFFSGIMAALLPRDLSPQHGVIVVMIVAFNEFVWYALVSLLFSGGRAQRLYRDARVWIERVTGGVLAVLGLRLALDR